MGSEEESEVEQDTTCISPEIVCPVVEDLENASTNQFPERENDTPAEFVADLDGSTDGTRLVKQLRNVSTDQFPGRETANPAPQFVGEGRVEQPRKGLVDQCHKQQPTHHVPQNITNVLVDESHKQQASGLVPQNVADPNIAIEEPWRVEHLRNVFVRNTFDQQPESLEVQRKAGDQHELHVSDHERPGCGKQLRIVEVDNGPKIQRPVPSADLKGRVSQLKMAFEEHKQVVPASVRATSEGSRVRHLRSVFLGNLNEEHNTVPTPRRGFRRSRDGPGRVKHLRNVWTSGNTDPSPQPHATQEHQSLESPGPHDSR